jgi:citrate lyase beta subunit
VQWAKRIVAAFEASPDAGVMSLDGQMIDKPHLVQARRILDLMARRGAAHAPHGQPARVAPDRR